MNNGLNHNPLHLPPGVTEADLVDLVDGALPREREGVVIDALRREPRLGLLVKQMRADRAELAELATVRIPQPVGMIEAVESKLDRSALSELVAESEEIPASIPISSYQPVRRGLVSIVAESAWGRRLATAASLAIVAGLGYFAVRELSKSWPTLPKTTTLAENTARETSTDTTSPDTPPHKAEIAAQPAAPDTVVHEPTTVAATTDTPPTVETAAAPKELTLPEALKLAEAGRLVICVRSTNYEGTLRHLQELSRASGRDNRWRAYELNALPQEFAALAAPLPDDAAAPDRPSLPGRPTPAPTVIADDDTDHAPTPLRLEPDAPTLVATPKAVHVRAVRVVQTVADTRALDDLLKDIAINKSHAARFRVLPESAAAEPAPALDAESILWWSRGGSAWVKRVMVPMVVETVE